MNRMVFTIATVSLLIWETQALPYCMQSADRTLAAQQLNIDAHRPLAEAAVTLERSYGYIITYEDPPYTYAQDLQDESAVPGSHVRAIVPRMRHFSMDQIPVTADRQMLRPVLARLLAEYTAQTEGTIQFRLSESDYAFHFVPSAIRDSGGTLRHITPVLDSPVSILERRDTAYQLLTLLCETLSENTGAQIGLATVPMQLIRVNIEFAASNEPARRVLARLLQEAGLTLSWHLLYSPSRAEYFLNLGPAGRLR